LGFTLLGALGAAIGTAVGAIIACFVASSSILVLGAFIGGFFAVSAACFLFSYLAYRNDRRMQLEQKVEQLGLSPEEHQAPPLETYVDNSVFMTQNSRETAHWKLDLIDHAEQSIELSGNFCGGPIFCEALDRIERRLRDVPALKVHIISNDDLLESPEVEKMKQLAAEFPERFNYIVINDRFEWSNTLKYREMHIKAFVVDEKYFVIGGSGMHQELCTDIPETEESRNCLLAFFPKASRDMDAIAVGPTAKTLRLVFFKMYALWEAMCTGKEVENHFFPIDEEGPIAVFEGIDNHPSLVNASMKLTLTNPDDPINKGTLEYISLINQAKRNVTLAQLFLNPAPELMQALERAAERVHLKVITSGNNPDDPFLNIFFALPNCSNYYPLSVKPEARHLSLEELREEDLTATEIWEYYVANSWFHKKILRVDEDITVCGSWNCSLKSDGSDPEVLLTIKSREIAQQTDRVIEEDTRRSQLVPLEDRWYYYSNCCFGIRSLLHNQFFSPIFG
jgi:phosphatidylserine/phosphatidylglycerophosphate/cardiolipin synthase-like enzyme